MSDLRDRIAKVLHARFGPSLGAAEGGWDDEPAATKDVYRRDADAVIAASETNRIHINRSVDGLLGESDNPQPLDRTDSLRDRIAAAQAKHHPVYSACDTCTDFNVIDSCTCGGWAAGWLVSWDDHVADAVIEALGLYREGGESRTVTNEQGATYFIQGGYRYVTDWQCGDE